MVTGPRRKSRWARLSVLVFVAGAACNALVGIDQPSVVEQEHCATNGDCSNASYLCVFGLCSAPCSADGDCGPALRCLKTGEGSNGACVGGSSVECHDEGDCPGVPICSKGECRNDCVDDPSSCLADQTCGPDGACYGDDTRHDPTGSGGAGAGSGGGAGQAGRGSKGAGGSGASGTSGNGPNGGSANGATGGGNEAGGMSGATNVENAGEAGKGAGGEGGAPASKPECTDEGAVRCAGQAMTGRQICEKGTWRLKDTCPDGQLCDETDAACAPVVDECRGRSPGEVFCDGAVRTVCGSDLVSVEQTQCDSAQLCDLGTGPDCAACLPNDHRCVNQTLEGCKSDDTGFETISECTDAPCNADAGACTALACLRGQKRCNGDALEQCKTDQSGFELVMNCGAGLCDSSALACDVCVHGAKRCTDGSTVAVCNQDGQGETTMRCMDPMPLCTGAGICVQCSQTSDCTDTGACYTESCNVGTGRCEPTFNGTGSRCNGTGYCDAGGDCVECLNAGQCAPRDDCHPAQCSTAGVCQWPQASENATCNGDEFCDASGACVECTTGSQCTASECNTPVCTANGSCDVTPKGGGVTCSSGRVCDGNGNCVACYGNAQCSTDDVCRSNACVAAIHTAGWDGATSSTSTLAANVIYLRRLGPLVYPATLKAFGVVVPSGASATAKLALYADDATNAAPTGPSLAESGSLGLPTSAGAREQAASPNAALSAGAYYWIALVLNASAPLDAGTDLPAGKQVSSSFTNGFPTMPASGLSNYSTEIAVYVRVEDTQ